MHLLGFSRTKTTMFPAGRKRVMKSTEETERTSVVSDQAQRLLFDFPLPCPRCSPKWPWCTSLGTVPRPHHTPLRLVRTQPGERWQGWSGKPKEMCFFFLLRQSLRNPILASSKNDLEFMNLFNLLSLPLNGLGLPAYTALGLKPRAL